MYQCIEAAGNTGWPDQQSAAPLHVHDCWSHVSCFTSGSATGLWTKDMKFKTNLQQPQITKILKVLEGRSLVKAIKPVNQPSKKFYMLFDLDPAREITGGAW